MRTDAPLETRGDAPLMTTFQELRAVRQSRYNPLRQFKPETLANWLEQFEYGDLRNAALLFEVIAERDDTLMSVKPKREKAVSQLDMQVLAAPNSGEAGAAHKAVLEAFWKNVRAVNAYDRNITGGFKLLIRQMMTAVSYRYACHHIIWQPGGDDIRATFEFVPLWLFENRTGKLRYLRTPFATEGVPMAEDEWMVTTGDGLMIACSIGYQAKRSAFNDWLIFSEKFSVPGVLGRTPHKKGTPEGEAMRQAVQSFGHDFVGVVYGDDGNHTEPLKIIQAQGSPSAMPMPAVIERVDRKFAALYRGADLSTMSAGSGEGSGASLQGKEADVLLTDDAEMINGKLAEISRKVIEWHFGQGVEPLATAELIVPADEDGKFLLDASGALADRGAPVSIAATMDRLGIQKAEAPEDRLGSATRAAAPVPTAGQVDEINASLAQAMRNRKPVLATKRVRAALNRDHLPIAEKIEKLLRANATEVRAGLEEISATLTEQLGSMETGAELGNELAAAYVEGLDLPDLGTPENGRAGDIANAADAPVAEDGWFKVAPYGEFPGNSGRMQHFGPEQARAMVAWFGSISQRLRRLFRGLPIYIGHPDKDPKRWPDERRLGRVVKLEAREDGLWALPVWNRLGRENLAEGYWVFPSPRWDAPADQPRFAPDRMISIGLTNTPQIQESEPIAST